MVVVVVVDAGDGGLHQQQRQGRTQARLEEGVRVRDSL